MNSPKASRINPQLSSLISNYWRWRGLWILTTVLFCGAGIAYAYVLKKDTWVASQALIVRDEATGAVMRLGRFESQTQMKASQETVLEMARHPQVAEAALNAVGRPPRLFGMLKNDSPPSRAEIEQFAKYCVVVRAPRGAELGTTEVIYLDVKQDSPERAVQLATAVCDALQSQLQSVRIELSTGVIQELEAARAVCEASLQEATDQLQKMEVEAGSDLADLRGLSDTTVGSTNRLMLDMVRDELRKADMAVRTMEPSYKLARSAIADPSLVLQAAEILKDVHPAISRLRDGLAEARVKTANLEGRYTSNHPDVVNARRVEAAFQENILKELAVVVNGYKASISISQQKIDALNAQELELGKRLNRLADIRGKYTNLLAEVKSRADSLSQIKKELNQAMASRDAAQAASLLTRLDSPEIGEKPVGPGRTTIVGGATVGGLMLGLGVVFLIVPIDGSLPSSKHCPARDPNRTQSNRKKRDPTVSSIVRQHVRYAAPVQAMAAPTVTAEAKVKSTAAKATSTISPINSQVAEPTATYLPPVEAMLQTASSPTGTSSLQLPNQHTSATSAAQSFDSQSSSKPETMDDVRALIANALKCHVKSESV
jgi:polysaccharide biosynthesis transport protein